MSRKVRPPRIEGNDAFILLTKGYEAVINVTDLPLVGGSNWSAQCKYRQDGSVVAVYAIRKVTSDGVRRTERMHRILFGAADHQEVDHRDGNGLNNRRGNLRAATSSQNSQNRGLRNDNKSGVKGIWWNEKQGSWMAYIGVSGVRRHLGYFKEKQEAATAVDRARNALHGEFGRVA